MDSFIDTIDQETLDRVMEAIRVLVEEITKVLNNVVQHLLEVWKPIIDEWVIGFGDFCSKYDNQRVVSLAYHAKKARVRNKNHNRLVDDYIKHLSCMGGGKSSE